METLTSDTAGAAEPLPRHKALTGGHTSHEPRAVAPASELAASKLCIMADNMSVLKSCGFDSGRLRSELQALHSNQDLQGNRGKLCDFLLFLKDMELDSATPQLYKLLS